MQSLNSLVTGGLQGIGREIVQQLKQRGDNVFVFDIVEQNDPVVNELTNQGILYFQVDVSSIESIQNGFSSFFNVTCGKIDVLVNNAGITRDGLAIRMNEQDWDSVLHVNLKGAFFCCQYAIKQMMRQNKGYIINISSIVGLTGNAGQANYAASKAGLISLTKTLAMEYGSRNILVNAIAPGFIKTQMTEKLSSKIKDSILSRISLKRFGDPKDVANLVCFLTSGQADYVTGSVIDLNGGMF